MNRWSVEEDRILLDHVARLGTRHWKLLEDSGKLPNRDNRSCYRRYCILSSSQARITATEASPKQHQQQHEHHKQHQQHQQHQPRHQPQQQLQESEDQRRHRQPRELLQLGHHPHQLLETTSAAAAPDSPGMIPGESGFIDSSGIHGFRSLLRQSARGACPAGLVPGGERGKGPAPFGALQGNCGTHLDVPQSRPTALLAPQAPAHLEHWLTSAGVSPAMEEQKPSPVRGLSPVGSRQLSAQRHVQGLDMVTCHRGIQAVAAAVRQPGLKAGVAVTSQPGIQDVVAAERSRDSLSWRLSLLAAVKSMESQAQASHKGMESQAQASHKTYVTCKESQAQASQKSPRRTGTSSPVVPQGQLPGDKSLLSGGRPLDCLPGDKRKDLEGQTLSAPLFASRTVSLAQCQGHFSANLEMEESNGGHHLAQHHSEVHDRNGLSKTDEWALDETGSGRKRCKVGGANAGVGIPPESCPWNPRAAQSKAWIDPLPLSMSLELLEQQQLEVLSSRLEQQQKLQQRQQRETGLVQQRQPWQALPSSACAPGKEGSWKMQSRACGGSRPAEEHGGWSHPTSTAGVPSAPEMAEDLAWLGALGAIEPQQVAAGVLAEDDPIPCTLLESLQPEADVRTEDSMAANGTASHCQYGSEPLPFLSHQMIPSPALPSSWPCAEAIFHIPSDRPQHCPSMHSDTTQHVVENGAAAVKHEVMALQGSGGEGNKTSVPGNGSGAFSTLQASHRSAQGDGAPTPQVPGGGSAYLRLMQAQNSENPGHERLEAFDELAAIIMCGNPL